MTQATSDGVVPPRNVLAVWSLILGIVALVLSVLVVGGLVGVVAMVLGGIAFTRPGRNWMSLAGIVMGGVSLPVAVVAVALWFIVPHAYSSKVESARRAGTISDLSNTKTALAIFEVDVGRYPSTAEGLQALVSPPAGAGDVWAGPYLEKAPADKWGYVFVYRYPGVSDPTSYDLLSVGPDGVEGTEDDVQTSTEY